MHNFLDPKLLPKITQKPACTDHYEVDNLISSNYAENSRGFIAYPSTKPPVEVEFELLCNMNIHYVILKTSVGNQRCSGIELLAKTNDSSYISIGKAIYEGDGVVLCNGRHYTKYKPPPYTNNIPLYFFKGSAFMSFLNASHLKVVILKTEKSVPCLARVEIWGHPSKQCSLKTIETIRRLTKVEISEHQTKDVFKIPDEFKDDLTYELMTIPYTLPSGKTVDQTTLEKHIESEKSFARKPGDPFTGLKFNDRFKPILNVGLKSRIDMFLMEHAHRKEFFNLKRSVGHLGGPNAKKVKLSNCASCENTFEYLYQLPCPHSYCRQCLLSLCEKTVCLQCEREFKRENVVKVNVASL